MVPRYKGYLLFVIVALVGVLMMVNIYLIRGNGQIIELSQERVDQAEQIKINTVDVIRSLHLLDLAIRSYAFVRSDHYLAAIDTATANNQAALASLEQPLLSQAFPMEEFYALRDSVQGYLMVTREMMQLIASGNREAFVSILEEDPGYDVYLTHQRFSAKVTTFENTIVTAAQMDYDQALTNSYLLQILLFLLAIPTLAYTAYYTNRVVAVTEKLRQSEVEKGDMLLDQNQLLERTVNERTREILAQSEEITTRNEQLLLQQGEIEKQRNSLSEQNEALQEAKRIIEQQSLMLQQRNIDLGEEVARQTRDLKQTNLELIEKNSRLEQFTFVISHNLRAPLARLVGLSTILRLTDDPRETLSIVDHMIASTNDLDQVVKDLSLILNIQKINAQVMQEIRLDEVMRKIMRMLEPEIKETGAKFTIDFAGANTMVSLPPYIESILYNLTSNAIKYRHPERLPVIQLSSAVVDDHIRIDIADNGLGIDIEKYKHGLFNLYKRFHFHVEGKGLGLYLVKTQTDALRGRIEVRSEVDKGTTFELHFPMG